MDAGTGEDGNEVGLGRTACPVTKDARLDAGSDRTSHPRECIERNHTDPSAGFRTGAIAAPVTALTCRSIVPSRRSRTTCGTPLESEVARIEESPAKDASR